MRDFPALFHDVRSGRIGGNGRKVVVFDNEAACTAFVVAAWHEICSETLKTGPYVSAALSGGKTPVGAYSALAREKQDLPWEMIHIFMVDERFVPHSGTDSNFGMICRALLNSIPIAKENIHPIETNLPGPAEAARDYENELSRHFGLRPGQLPRFDIIMLGLGEDGHTASIFPGDPLPDNTSNMVRAVFSGGKLHDRITLTMPVINNGLHVLMLVLGAPKATILKKVVEENDSALPASRVRPVNGNFLILADRKAAGLLARESYVKEL